MTASLYRLCAGSYGKRSIRNYRFSWVALLSKLSAGAVVVVWIALP